MADVAPRGPAPRAEPEATERLPRVLVVDDDPEMRALVVEELRQEGYEVAEARDGAEAVLAVRAGSYDVILMDKNMPGPSGLDLLPGFRRTCPGSRIIMMTAFGDVPSYVEALEKGAVEYLFKPFRMEEMKAAVRRAFGSAPAGSA
ncbi:MAG TPA: response regulator [Methylomirabilota bacterium]|jgi:DNA-binding response OmpR family regulator|nr:response regulator [Methylomirabilota bacterium]